MPERMTLADAVARFRKVHGDAYDYSEAVWIDRHSKLRIVCPRHGPFYQTYVTHGYHNARCRGCYQENLPAQVKWTSAEVDYLQLNYSTDLSRASLLEGLPGRTWRSVLHKAMSLGLPTDRKYAQQDRLGHLLSPTVENAYLWGLIYADGWLSPQGGLVISLGVEDEAYLTRLGVKYSLGDTKPSDSTGRMRKLRVQDAARVRLLQQHLDYHEKKTYNPPTHFSFLEDEAMRLAFFIGMVDGDGSLRFSQTQGTWKFRSLVVTQHHNWFPFWESFASQLTEDTGLQFRIHLNHRSNAQVEMNRISQHAYLVDFIERNQLPVLERKWYNKGKGYVTETARKSLDQSRSSS